MRKSMSLETKLRIAERKEDVIGQRIYKLGHDNIYSILFINIKGKYIHFYYSMAFAHSKDNILK